MKSIQKETREIAVALIALEKRCAHSGLWETMHAVNDAKNKLGKEAERIILEDEEE